MSLRVFNKAVLVSLLGISSPFLLRDSLYGQGSDSIPSTYEIYELMERTDLTIEQVEARAAEYFNKRGTGRGTGFKHYQRWLYEMKFHLDENGYPRDPREEFREYENFLKRNPSTRSTIPWTELGPGTWTNTSSWNPGVGRVTSVAVHPTNPAIMYISTPAGGIWKSTNEGANWYPLLDQVSSSWMKIYHVTFDPSSPNTMYAAVINGGVIKSTNSGVTWTSTGSGPNNTRKVVVHPNNSSIVLATSANGIYRSANGGTTWTQTSTFNCEDLEFKPLDPNIVYVSGNAASLRRSTDNGVTWSTIGSGQGITHSGRTLLGVSIANPNVVYAVQANDNIFGRMYKSTNAGATFITTVIGDPAQGTNYFGYSTNGTDNNGQAGYDMGICVNPTNADIVMIAGIICWKSTNGGNSFVAQTAWSYPNGTGYNHADVHALEWIGSTIYSGSDGGVYKSINSGGDWIDLTNGIGIKQVYRLSCAKTNEHMITTGAQDNGSSFRQSNGVWWEWLGADGMDNMISHTNPNIAFGTSQFGDLYKTTNNGQSYSGVSSPSEGNWITPIAMHPTTHTTIYAGWTGVYKSMNSGSSWSNISSGYINRKLDVLAIAPSNANYIYAAATNKLFRTTNGGTSWDSITTTANVSSIYISATDPQKIWISLNTTSNHVQFSTNSGNTFTSISSGLPALNARTVVVDENDPNGVYVGLNVGVYYRNDVNPTWTLFGSGFPLVAVNELEIHAGSDKIRAATYGRGVWENGVELPACSNVVTNLNDTGPGSLRMAIGCLSATDSIVFDNTLNGAFIDLVSSIVIERNIKLHPNPNAQIKIRTNENGPLFKISAGKTASFKNIELFGGVNLAGRAIVNLGTLNLQNMIFYDHVSGDGTLIQNNGTINLSGSVEIKN